MERLPAGRQVSDISYKSEFDPPPLLETTLDLEGNGWGGRQTFYKNILLLTKSGGGVQFADAIFINKSYDLCRYHYINRLLIEGVRYVT